MLRTASLALMTLSIVFTTASAEPAKPPEALVQARKAFAAAVASNNANGAAELTSFPLKNIVFQEPPTVSRAGFSKTFASYRNMKSCIQSQAFERDGRDWAINCDGNVLSFGLRNGRWLHTKYENINE